ncbi:MAG: ATP-binding protein [bacterium]|nr:ATP-binding protein [bacterium]
MNQNLHPIPIPNAEEMSIERLVELFREFSEQSTGLRSAYAELEQRVAELSQELARKDREIYSGYNNLWEFQAYLDSILESIPVGLVVIDLLGQITRLNRSAREILNLAPEELPSSTIFFDTQEPTIPANDLTEPARIGVPTERIIERPQGSVRIRQVVSWLYNRAGERMGMVVSLEDLTAIQMLEQRIDEQKTLVALGEMAAHVAHELRNPLFGIGGFAQILLEETPETDDRYRLIKKINEGVDSLNRIATTLLNYTRTGEPTFERVDLQQLLNDVADWVANDLQDKQSKIAIDLDLPVENIPVKLDKELMREALLNLAKNAKQAMSKGGLLLFGLRWDLMKNRVIVTVSDTGVGIAPENQERIFNPFFTTRSTGTGLGLAVVSKIVRLHHGTISVSSEIGVGSQFTMELPIV